MHRSDNFLSWLALVMEEADRLDAAGRSCCAASTRVCIEQTLAHFIAHLETYLTVADAAQVSGKSPSQIRRWIREGRLDAIGGEGEGQPLQVRMTDIPFSERDTRIVLDHLRARLHELQRDHPT